MSDLVVNPEDRFSRVAAHMVAAEEGTLYSCDETKFLKAQTDATSKHQE